MGFLTDLINRFPELSAFKAQLSEAENRFNALEQENRSLKEEIRALNARQKPDAHEGEFYEASGVLWKKNRNGSFESSPCCPTCKSTLADYSGSLLCLKCNWQAPLKTFEVPKVHHELLEQK
jgi:hypothetical protein